MSNQLPELLEKEEEFIPIDPVDVDLKIDRDDEKINWKGHPHIASKMLTILLGLTLLIVGVIGLPISIIGLDMIWVGITGISALFGFLTLLFIYIHIKYTRCVLTDTAVYKQVGLIRDSVTKIPVDKLQTITYKQSIPEKLLNFGTIGMSTGGHEVIELKFAAVKNPKLVHDLIDDLMEERVERSRRIVSEDQIDRIRQLEKELDKTKRQLDKP